jgi:hypothetical protein
LFFFVYNNSNDLLGESNNFLPVVFFFCGKPKHPRTQLWRLIQPCLLDVILIILLSLILSVYMYGLCMVL